MLKLRNSEHRFIHFPTSAYYNHNCCKISLRSLIILTRESKGSKKKKKKSACATHTFKTLREPHPCLNLKNYYHWRKIIIFPSIPFHTYFYALLTLETKDLQQLVTISTVKKISRQRKTFLPFSQHVENSNYVIQTTFDILPSPGIDSGSLHACIHALHSSTYCSILHVYRKRSRAVLLLRHELEWVPHPPRAQAWYVGDTSMPRMRRKSGSVSNEGDFEAARSCARDSP